MRQFVQKNDMNGEKYNKIVEHFFFVGEGHNSCA